MLNSISRTTALAAPSKNHVDGERGTPFSRCVSAAAKLLKNQLATEQPTVEQPAS